MSETTTIRTLLPVLIPIVVIELALLAAALADLSRRPAEQVRGHNKWIWVAVIVLINFIGPIVYFVAGREE
ncbi:MAG: PLDc_N domain-containing protein [Anaerolineae bacterium]|nr:PLDc_N domain-containing protein [Anaerolineae bacterium]